MPEFNRHSGQASLKRVFSHSLKRITSAQESSTALKAKSLGRMPEFNRHSGQASLKRVFSHSLDSPPYRRWAADILGRCHALMDGRAYATPSPTGGHKKTSRFAPGGFENLEGLKQSFRERLD
ncbi:hypothetical protein [Prosthecobacter sp.]|uniref:hypothetical protein n=1 Tax=Prosthecobacter sp. TaxID=1965333 RepID=UPI0037835B97